MATKKQDPSVSRALVLKVMREMGSKGGKARVPKGAAMLSDEERKARASAAAKARWGNRAKEKGVIVPLVLVAAGALTALAVSLRGAW